VRVEVVGREGLTPLIAVRDDLRPLLLEKGADAARASHLGLTALHGAASAKTAAELIRRGANVHARITGPPHAAGFTPLHLAPNPETAAALLDGGAEIDAVDQRGRTALHLRAQSRGEAEFVKLLCRRGANVDLQDADGNAPLHHVSETSAKALLAAKPDLGLRNAAGRPPLFEALRFWARLDSWEKLALKAIDQFFAAGQDPAATDAAGENLLHAAVRLARRPDVVQRLLAAGVDVNGASATGATPLHVWAAEGQKADVGAALLAGGADPDRRDAQGLTAADLVAARPETFRKVLQL
jgi:ankyrin repeat protein